MVKYLTLRYTLDGSYTNCVPKIFDHFRTCLLYAHREAKTGGYFFITNIHLKHLVKVKIFEVPDYFTLEGDPGEDDNDYGEDKYMEYYLKTIYDEYTTLVMKLQKRWRKNHK